MNEQIFLQAKISNISGRPTAAPNSPLNFVQRYPLFFFFLITFGVTWISEWLFFIHLDQPYTIWINTPILILGPTTAAFIITALADGRPGLRRLLLSYVQWRVGVQWYLFALIGIPAVELLGAVSMQGTLASFQAKHWAFLLFYPVYFVLVLFTGPFLEEAGWRGFALPRLQQDYGPLLGSLSLGILWGMWRLPLFFVPGWSSENGSLSITSIGVYVLITVAVTLIMTWVYHHTQGSLLIAMLVYTSANAAQEAIKLFFPAVATTTVYALVGLGILALVLVIITRGRLGYD
jgi:uncharacterized protein